MRQLVLHFCDRCGILSCELVHIRRLPPLCTARACKLQYLSIGSLGVSRLPSHTHAGLEYSVTACFYAFGLAEFATRSIMFSNCPSVHLNNCPFIHADLVNANQGQCDWKSPFLYALSQECFRCFRFFWMITDSGMSWVWKLKDEVQGHFDPKVTCTVCPIVVNRISQRCLETYPSNSV